MMYDLVTDHPHIRQARWEDFVAIDGWRAAHFLEMAARGSKRPVTEQADFSTACWAVYVDENDKPLAGIGFRDHPHERQRHVTDLYATPSRAGKRAGMALVRVLEAMSDRDGYEIRGSTDPENVDYLKHVVARGYEMTAVSFRRVPRG